MVVINHNDIIIPIHFSVRVLLLNVYVVFRKPVARARGETIGARDDYNNKRRRPLTHACACSLTVYLSHSPLTSLSLSLGVMNGKYKKT